MAVQGAVKFTRTAGRVLALLAYCKVKAPVVDALLEAAVSDAGKHGAPMVGFRNLLRGAGLEDVMLSDFRAEPD